MNKELWKNTVGLQLYDFYNRIFKTKLHKASRSVPPFPTCEKFWVRTCYKIHESALPQVVEEKKTVTSDMNRTVWQKMYWKVCQKHLEMIVTKWGWKAAGNLARLYSVIATAHYEYSSITVCECCIQVMFSESLLLYFTLIFYIRTRHFSGYQFQTFSGTKTRVFRDITDKNCTLKQIWHVVDLLKQMFSGLRYPLHHICIDGRLILRKGITALKQHTSAKWQRLEIKLFQAWNVKTKYTLIS